MKTKSTSRSSVRPSGKKTHPYLEVGAIAAAYTAYPYSPSWDELFFWVRFLTERITPVALVLCVAYWVHYLTLRRWAHAA